MATPFLNSLVSGQLATPSATHLAVAAPAAAPNVAVAAPGTPKSNGAFWTGADGNVWVAGAQGTHSAGKADANTNAYWTSRGFTPQSDPNAPKTDAPTDPNNTGGSGGPVVADKSDDIVVQNAGLAANDAQTSSAIDKIHSSLANILGGYDTEAQANTKNYTLQSNTNQNQLQTSKQTALVNAASGRQGLLGTLGSIGALSGDSIKLANNAVQHGANEDLSGAGETYAQNQSGLDTSINAFKAADDARRKNANTAATADEANAKNGGAVAKQNFLRTLSDDYAAQGDKVNSMKYAQLAAALYPEIASTNVPAQSLAPSTAAYTPASLASYMSKGNTIVQASTPSQAGGLTIPGLSATTKKQTAATAA